MAREKTKTILLDAGQRIFLERGYNSSGIEAIVQAAGVPKGSFYYYFSNKEEFGLRVLDRFAEDYETYVDLYLGDATFGPRERLFRYFEAKIQCLESMECRKGCLVGNLSQEMADQSETFRARLEEIFGGWADRFAGCIRQAQDANEIASQLDAHDLGEFLLNAWQGAVLRAKTLRSNVPLRAFLSIMFGAVLQPPCDPLGHPVPVDRLDLVPVDRSTESAAGRKSGGSDR